MEASALLAGGGGGGQRRLIRTLHRRQNLSDWPKFVFAKQVISTRFAFCNAVFKGASENIYIYPKNPESSVKKCINHCDHNVEY